MISVVIATHNGAATLPLLLETLRKVAVPAEGVEIIAVDNASSDSTRAVLEAHLDALPLTVLAEPRRGKSFALNRGLAAAKGELIVFADDDVLPAAEWLKAYRQAAEDWPEADLFAGQVRHHWQKEPPSWLRRLAEEGRSYGGTPIDLEAGFVGIEVFKGANFMIRRRALEGVRFAERAELNFAGSDTAGGEDTAFVRDALSRGHLACYVPCARVQHIVRPHQVGLRPVLRRYLRIGRAIALSHPDQFDPKAPRLFGYPRYVFKVIPRGVLGALRHWARGDTRAAVGELIDIATTWGRAQQWRRDRRRRVPGECLKEKGA